MGYNSNALFFHSLNLDWVGALLFSANAQADIDTDKLDPKSAFPIYEIILCMNLEPILLFVWHIEASVNLSQSE